MDTRWRVEDRGYSTQYIVGTKCCSSGSEVWKVLIVVGETEQGKAEQAI